MFCIGTSTLIKPKTLYKGTVCISQTRMIERHHLGPDEGSILMVDIFYQTEANT